MVHYTVSSFISLNLFVFGFPYVMRKFCKISDIFLMYDFSSVMYVAMEAACTCAFCLIVTAAW